MDERGRAHRHRDRRTGVWSLIGGSAAFLLGIPQDWFLLFSGISVVLILLRDRNHSRMAVTA